MDIINLNCLPREEMDKFLTLTLVEEMENHRCTNENIEDFKSISKPYKDAIDVLNNIVRILRDASRYQDRLFNALQSWRFRIYDYLQNGYQLAS